MLSAQQSINALKIAEWSTKDEAAAELAFSQGDYTRAALQSDADELRGCSLVLLGNHERGLPLLEPLTTPRALFFAAFGHWGLGDSGRAEQLLAQINDAVWGPQARHLELLVRRKKFRILLQAREDPACPDYDVVGAFRAIPQADIKTVGYWSNADVVIDHTTTLAQVLERLPAGWKPDLFLSHMVEDYPPPIGIEDAPFPTVCHTQDFDRHFHHCGHFLKMFDATIALGSADHDDFRRLTGRAFVFPKLLGLGKASVEQSRLAAQPRTTDVFVSGTLFTLSQQKAEYLYDVAQLPARYKVEMLDGYTTTANYYERLAQAKATFTCVHRWGLINGRAIEAISVGTCAIYQEGGELGLFLSEDDGAIPYRPDNAMEVLTRVIDQWDEKYRDLARAGSQRVAEVFNLEHCIQRYFHFLAFCLTQNLQKPQRTREPVYGELRWPNRSPWRILGAFDNSLPKLAALQNGFRDRWKDSKDYARLDAVNESWVSSYVLEGMYPLPPLQANGQPTHTHQARHFAQRVARRLQRDFLRIRGTTRLLTILRRLTGIDLLPSVSKAAPPSKPSLERRRVPLQNAIDGYQSLSTQFPDRLAARFNLARLTFEGGDLTGASRHFAHILETAGLRYVAEDLLFSREFQDTGFAYERMMQQIVAYAKDRNARHLRAIEQMIRESTLLFLGSIHLQQERPDEAVRLLNQHLTAEAEFPALWVFAAKVWAATGEYSKAARALRQATALDRSVITTVPASLIAEIRLHEQSVTDLGDQHALLQQRRAA